MSSSEFHDFIQFKELQYHQRRQRLKEFCQNSVEDKVLWKHLVSPNKNAIIFDQVHHLAYCQIAKVISHIDFLWCCSRHTQYNQGFLLKVGSSTWCMHFLHLANASQHFIEQHSQALQVIKLSLLSYEDKLYYLKLSLLHQNFGLFLKERTLVL